MSYLTAVIAAFLGAVATAYGFGTLLAAHAASIVPEHFANPSEGLFTKGVIILAIGILMLVLSLQPRDK